MLSLIFYYIVLPLLAAWWLVRLIKKHAPSPVPPDVAALCANNPVEKRFFRTVRRDSGGLAALGDFETQPEAVECAYRERETARQAGRSAAFLVLNDKGEVLEEVDA